MCRGQRSCTEIPNRTSMHPLAPLPLPARFTAALSALHAGVRLAAAGDTPAAQTAFACFPDADTRTWGIEHGQISSKFRHRLPGEPSAPPLRPGVGPRNVSAVLARAVYERDRYQCRYCGLPVIPREVLKAATAVVGPVAFGSGRRNEDQHGGALLSWAQLDHVVPWSQGGATDLANVVTSCWACNYGKHNYALEQIGVADPRNRPPAQKPWDGLVSLLPALRREAAARPATAACAPAT